MKYKRLSEEELQMLEKEFVNFLIINGITAEDWEKLKKDEPGKASEIVDHFSDVIYETWLRKINYLEMILPQEILCFYYQPGQAVLVGLSTTDASVDFTTMTDLSEADLIKSSTEIYTQTKVYSKTREEEMFELLEKGAKPSDEKLFNILCMGLA